MGVDYQMGRYIGFRYPASNKHACYEITNWVARDDYNNYIRVIEGDVKCVLFCESEKREEFGRLFEFESQDEFGETEYPWTGIESITKEEYFDTDNADNFKDSFKDAIIGWIKKEFDIDVELEYWRFADSG